MELSDLTTGWVSVCESVLEGKCIYRTARSIQIVRFVNAGEWNVSAREKTEGVERGESRTVRVRHLSSKGVNITS